MTPESQERLDQRNDEALLAAAGAGECSAQDELVRRHYRHIAGLAYRLLGKADLAEDAAQDVFVKLLAGKARFAGRSQFGTWLTRVVLNLCVDYRRRRRPTQALPADLPQHESAANLADDQAYVTKRIQSAIGKLPERQRTALILHRYQNRSYRQIAETTGWSESAVESLVIRAYSSLREKLADLKEM